MDDDHQIQWSFISKLLDKLEDQADRIGWDGLIDEATKVFDMANKETDTAKVFFEPYQYLFRLYYRVKKMDSPAPFNETYKVSHLINHKDEPFIRLKNYDYKSFLWARKNGFVDYLSNDIIDIPMSELSQAQIRAFEKHLKN